LATQQPLINSSLVIVCCCTFSGSASHHCYCCCWFGLLLRRLQWGCSWWRWGSWQSPAVDPSKQPTESQPHPLHPLRAGRYHPGREKGNVNLCRGRCGYSATMTCYHLNKLQSYFCSCTETVSTIRIVCSDSQLCVILLCATITCCYIF